MGLPTKNNTRGGVEYDKWKSGGPTDAPNGEPVGPRLSGWAYLASPDRALATSGEHAWTRSGYRLR